VWRKRIMFMTCLLFGGLHPWRQWCRQAKRERAPFLLQEEDPSRFSLLGRSYIDLASGANGTPLPGHRIKRPGRLIRRSPNTLVGSTISLQ
jgi:hypothetical protein